MSVACESRNQSIVVAMPSAAIECMRIELDDAASSSSDGVYAPGVTIRGVAHVELREAIKARYVSLRLVGEANSDWNEVERCFWPTICFLLDVFFCLFLNLEKTVKHFLCVFEVIFVLGTNHPSIAKMVISCRTGVVLTFISALVNRWVSDKNFCILCTFNA